MTFTGKKTLPFDGVRRYLRRNLPYGRYMHSELTASLAASLCIRFGVPQEKGFFAGLAHDIARDLSKHTVLETAKAGGYELSSGELKRPLLAHGKAGAALLAGKFAVDDPEVLEAVALHTLGAPGMGGLAKIVYCADYLERGRPHVDERFREEVFSLTLDGMTCRVMEKVFGYLESRGKPVWGASRVAYRELCGNETANKEFR